MSSNQLLSVFLLLTQTVCVLVPIINKNAPTQPGKFNVGEIILIGFFIIGFGLSLAIYFNAQDDEKTKSALEEKYRNELSQKLAERDSIHEVKDSALAIEYGNRVDSSYSKSITASNEALAKYNLVLIDSMNRVSTKINFKSTSPPQLTLEASTEQGGPIYLDKDSSETLIKMKFRSYNNVSYNIDLTICILNTRVSIYKNLEFEVLSCAHLFDRKFLVPEVTTTAGIPISKECLEIQNGVIVLHGEFSDDELGQKKRVYSAASKFNFVTNKRGNIIEGKELTNLIDNLLSKGFLK